MCTWEKPGFKSRLCPCQLCEFGKLLFHSVPVSSVVKWCQSEFLPYKAAVRITQDNKALSECSVNCSYITFDREE